MKVTSVNNPVWANADHTAIICNITVDIYGDEIMPFSANPLDTEEHGRTLYAELIAGIHGPVAEYIAPVIEPVIVDGVEQPVTTGSQTL